MPGPANPEQQSRRLLTSTNDWINSLPPPEVVSSAVWREERVPLETWLYDPGYMNLRGITLSPIQLGALEAMDDIDPSTNKYVEFVLEWGKGSGKDFIAALAALRQCYSLLCLRNPYTYYGLADNTGIQLCNVAYTKAQATEIYFGQLKGLLRGSPWFERRKYVIKRQVIELPREITLVSAAADGDSIEGKNLFFAVMDEASAFRDANIVKAMAKAEGQKVEKAADAIYGVLRSSANSRFGPVGKVVMISYPRYVDDFIQTRRKVNEEMATGWTSGPHATWEVNPRVTRASLQDDYERNEELALAMYECKPPFAEDGYIKHPDRYLKAVAAGGKIGLRPPTDEFGQFQDHFYGLPGRFYAAHVDLGATKDKCGLALGRQGEPVQRQRCPCKSFNLRDAEVCVACARPRERWIVEDLPTLVFTAIMQFGPKPPVKEVNFGEVRELIMAMKQRNHYIWALSYDGWQSLDSRQIMGEMLGKRKVFERWADPEKKQKEEDIVQLLSVDRNTEAHDTLKEFIYDERCFIYPESTKPEDYNTGNAPGMIAFQEWRKLRIINGKKIDHPIGGSKDVIDAMAGVAYHVARMPIMRYRTPSFAGFKPK